MEYPKFKVCCCCFTFNHAKYITDAMNGFTMQQTSFPFICTIVDDASTDGEQDVIRKHMEENFDFSEGSVAFHHETDYAHIIYAQHKTNKNCYFAVLYLKENHYSQRKPKMGYLSEWRDMCEYEAICEGDDYWIVPDKLEKQVKFLDSNSNYGMCGGNAYYYIQKNRTKFKMNINKKEVDFYSALLCGQIGAPTCTVMFRLSAIIGYTDFITSQRWPLGDLPMWLYILRNYKIKIFEDLFSVYRILEESASHSKTYEKAKSFQDGVLNVQLFFARAFSPILIPEIEKRSAKKQFIIASHYGRTRDALLYSKKVQLYPKDYLRIIRSLFICKK